MGFINEEISEDDKVKYGVDKVYEKFQGSHGIYPTNWTVDKEREMYLRIVRSQGREFAYDKPLWCFYWGGEVIYFELESISFEGERGGDIRAVERIVNLQVPDVIVSQKNTILADLEEALKSRGDSSAKSYHLTLEY